RYSYTKVDKWSDVPGQKGLVEEKAPQVDFYDSHITIGKNMTAFDQVGLPNDILLRVFDEFFAGNYTEEREPKSYSQLEPYVKTPEEHEALKKLIESTSEGK